GGWFLEHDNSIAANNLLTPAQIKPVWYFTAFYASCAWCRRSPAPPCGA
ncbi:cytochrome b/b6 domain protein, partial [Rhodanobacter sp. 115]